jgi:hypothetical protein
MAQETKPAFCEKHGVQNYVLTSPSLANAIEKDSRLEIFNVINLAIESHGKKYNYVVEAEFLRMYINIPDTETSVLLLDRDKTMRQINDRLIIQKILHDLKWVCPLCLESVLIK